jgi:hypothetical protein
MPDTAATAPYELMSSALLARKAIEPFNAR